MPPVSDRIYRVQAPYDGNAVHLYLVRGARLALIDSGAGDSPSTAVEPALRELGLSWTDLDYLLNTHGHADHAGGNGEVKASAPQVQIGIHPGDRYLLDGPHAHLDSPTDSSAAMRLLGREDLLREREVVLRQVIGRTAGVERELVDGDVVDLGQDVRLTVVHTPGHTLGSVCYVWERGQTVFSGDAGAAIDRATAEALRQLGPQASFGDLAEAAFRELVFDLPLLFDRSSRVPVVAARAISAHLLAQGWTPPVGAAAA